ncbi:hypothetical protein HQ346_10635 [Rhodococcus sp. BP-252]|uniref:AMIN-like domain-containing (lipo)protein n=1 Tax=unclassified Rhodococcus (in: high G+C Gram-positive bacteria) TaxID=192944 RepID=UPI001C9AD563|nr:MULTISPECIES: hypothetical protein [unclassified Rhodococcus (in: high G+C Gram-positive bacteria)]MBY6412257.1 hypothetical protein [Rhodococcus sp. BP-320]MBY6416837.1 hypothetical protein [Rhodococcus sp. BP-321]MBY6421625.1 hypothetical protein [Rhodococcus sp. BP-324]MBY6426891.1 hypothetical protein [Rhodococcus sp. BP-323]MBY6432057.1 hypothetical protein [Rhodococcus sp. BP-322]
MRTAAALVAAALLVAGCSGDQNTSTEAETEPSTTHQVYYASGSMTVGYPTPAPPPTGSPSVVPGFVDQPPDSTFTIADVRIADGTAVFTFDGDGVVNYVARYVDEAAVYGSDQTVDVPGRSILQLDLITDPSADTTQMVRSTVTAPEAEGPVFVHTAQASEGVFQAFIGTSVDRSDIVVVPQQNPPTLTVSVTGAA